MTEYDLIGFAKGMYDGAILLGVFYLGAKTAEGVRYLKDIRDNLRENSDAQNPQSQEGNLEKEVKKIF